MYPCTSTKIPGSITYNFLISSPKILLCDTWYSYTPLQYHELYTLLGRGVTRLAIVLVFHKGVTLFTYCSFHWGLKVGKMVLFRKLSHIRVSLVFTLSHLIVFTVGTRLKGQVVWPLCDSLYLSLSQNIDSDNIYVHLFHLWISQILGFRSASITSPSFRDFLSPPLRVRRGGRVSDFTDLIFESASVHQFMMFWRMEGLSTASPMSSL